MTATRTRYPWDIWTDGKMHTILRGDDYTISTYNMQISLHGRARTNGLKVETSSFNEDGLEGLRFKFRNEKN